MKQELQLVKQTEFGGSKVSVYQWNGEMFMTTKQLGTALEYSEPTIAINKIINRNEYLKDEEFSVLTKVVNTDGKAYNTRLITEDGIYEITMLSKKPKAQEFRQFIRKLLKGLRKGELTITPSYQIDDPIARAKRWIDEEKHRQLLEGEVLQLNNKIEEYEPKVRYLDEILDSKDTMTVTQIAKDYGLSARRLNQILHEQGIQYKSGKQWVLYAKHAGKGYTQSKTHSYDKSNGFIGVNVQTVWTQKGRLLIHTTLESLGIVAEMDKDVIE